MNDNGEKKNAVLIRRPFINISMLILGCYFLMYGILNWKKSKDALVITGICIGVLLLNQIYHNCGRRARMTVTFLSAAAGVVFVLCEICIFSGYDRKADYSEDSRYIIVLGSRLDDGIMTETLRNRLDKALELEERTGLPLIISGGITAGNSVTEAEVMKEYLLSQNRNCTVITEDTATNTKENLTKIRNMTEDVPVILVTSDFHMYRSKMIAKAAGFSEVYGAAAKVNKIGRASCRERV